MTDLKPIEKLDDAVRAYLAECGEVGALTGWVLAYSLTSLTDDPDFAPLAFRSDFTSSFSTSPEAALGMAQLTIRRLEYACLYGEEDDVE